jgi:hypothetical protein
MTRRSTQMNRISTAGMTIAAITALAFSGTFGTAEASAHHTPKGPHLTHTHLTLHATKEKVTKNQKFKATVVAKLRAHKAGVAGETVDIQQRQKGATKWVDTGTTATTDSTGAATFTFVQAQTKQQYRITFAGDATYRHSHSGTITINRVKPAH